ncbi:MAG TPA: 50S ribosomal protein L11 methyltransferase [Usitatibacter sp.]|nr:50S ribosomal protein L11 methyltransferase [Usitatibacter sp.]
MKNFESFLRQATEVKSPEICPEIRLNLAADLATLWADQERWLGRLGLPAPYWGIAWPGGQAIARHVLDNPESFRGAAILDLGAGSGLCAIAAAKAGARRVHAADIDPFSALAIEANAGLNDVRVAIVEEDLIDRPSRWDVVLAADLWYEKFLAGRITPWLRRLAQDGTRVLVGDTGRAFLPRAGLTEVGRYAIPTSQSLEPGAAGAAAVWQLAAA